MSLTDNAGKTNDILGRIRPRLTAELQLAGCSLPAVASDYVNEALLELAAAHPSLNSEVFQGTPESGGIAGPDRDWFDIAVLWRVYRRAWRSTATGAASGNVASVRNALGAQETYVQAPNADPQQDALTKSDAAIGRISFIQAARNANAQSGSPFFALVGRRRDCDRRCDGGDY